MKPWKLQQMKRKNSMATFQWILKQIYKQFFFRNDFYVKKWMIKIHHGLESFSYFGWKNKGKWSKTDWTLILLWFDSFQLIFKTKSQHKVPWRHPCFKSICLILKIWILFDFLSTTLLILTILLTVMNSTFLYFEK